MCQILKGESLGANEGYKFVRCCMKVAWLGAVNIPWHAELGWVGRHIDKDGVGVLLREDVAKGIEYSISLLLPTSASKEHINQLAHTSGTRPCLYPDELGVTFYWGAGKGCISASWLLRQTQRERWRPDPRPKWVFAQFAECPETEQESG